MTAPRALLIALALLQAVGITDYVRRAACEEQCKQDGCDDNGPCDGSVCTCHCPGAPTMTIALASAVELPIARPTRVEFHPDSSLRATPDPREILHVPRPLSV